MKTMKTLLPMLLLVLWTACGTSEKETATSKTAEMVERIQGMEDSLFNSGDFNMRNAQALLDVYKAYAAAYPLDSLAPEYLFRAAGVAKSMRDPEQSVFLYDRIIKDYPSWDRLADTYYLKAFTFDSEMDRKGEAQQAYQQVIDQFPDHPFAEQARLSIQNLQYTDEELVAKFKRMAEEEAARKAQ
jgi:outer membrane protein assembly factor BamD (BamD/ComL family)